MAEAETSWGTLLKSSYQSWNEDKALRLSAAIAYYAVFSIAPLMVIAMGIAGLVFGGEAATGQIYDGLKGLIGAQAAEGVQAMVKSASRTDQGWMATIGGFVMLLLGASGVLGQLKDALNTVWGVKPKPGLGWLSFIQEKFLNFGMVLAIGFLMLASLVMSSILSAVHNRLGGWFALPTGVWWVLGLLISVTITTLLLAMIFKYLPDAKVRFQDVWLGAFITAVLLEVGKAALGWYLGLESTSSAYGTAGSVVLLLLWVYYTSCIALFGAEFTRAHARARGRPIEPSAAAEAVTHEERREEGMDCKGDEARVPGGPVPVPVPVPADSTAASAGYVHPPAHGYGDADHIKYAPPMPEPPPSYVPPARMKRPGLMDPLLSYLEARLTLLSLEGREALQQSVMMLLLAVVGIISVLIIWMLVTTALVGLLMDYLGGGWIQAVLWTAAAHALVVGLSGGVLWWRFRTNSWFADTLNEFRKDRQWLRNKNPKL